jgi:hypothetical protein
MTANPTSRASNGVKDTETIELTNNIKRPTDQTILKSSVSTSDEGYSAAMTSGAKVANISKRANELVGNTNR